MYAICLVAISILSRKEVWLQLIMNWNKSLSSRNVWPENEVNEKYVLNTNTPPSGEMYSKQDFTGFREIVRMKEHLFFAPSNTRISIKCFFSAVKTFPKKNAFPKSLFNFSNFNCGHKLKTIYFCSPRIL